jgi:anti-anti-sigma factor
MERNGNVAVFTFTPNAGHAENRLVEDLNGQADALAECHLMLDFTHVESLRSVELGTIINLHKKMKTSGGQLTLFNLKDSVYEIFTLTRLHTFLHIHRAEGMPAPVL